MADITPGGTFTSGETNIDHTKLNTACAGMINSTFHTGKSSIGANPSKTATEVMVYDTSSGTYKKGTLAQLFVDHTGLLTDRTAKTTPVAADALMIADSAAGNAYKLMTAANLLFGAAAHTAPIAADKLAVYNSSGSAIATITIYNLIAQLSAHTAPVTADVIMVAEAGGAARKMTLGNLVAGATAITTPTAAMVLPIHDGTDYKKVALSVLISGLGASVTSPAGTEVLQALDGSTLKKLLLSDLRTYVRGGLDTYIVAVSNKASGTDAGTFTSGSWATRELSALAVDTASVGSLASHQITIPAGTWRIKASIPGYRCDAHIAKLYNATDASDTLFGTSEFSGSGSTTNSRSAIVGRFTIASAKAFEIRHQCTTTRATDGLGKAANIGSTPELYSIVELWKE